MKTEELLKKYQKLIAKRLNCKPEAIKFYTDGVEIGTIDYEKKAEWDEDYIIDWSLGEFQVFIDENNELPQYFGTPEEHSAKHLPFIHYDLLISSFKLYQLQHCCAIMVSCNASIKRGFRNNKIGTILNSLRQDIGRIMNYSTILCTDVEQNTYQRRVLKTNGWTDVYSVKNKRTNNKVYLTVKDL